MRTWLIAFVLATAPTANAADFNVHEGPNIFVGNGGEKTIHDGVDFWINGSSPPRSFQLLEYLTADINSSGLNGMISVKRLPGKIAKQTKELVGDAVIVLDESSRSWVGGATANTYYNTTYVNQKNFFRTTTRYAVVKYVGDAPDTTATEPTTEVPATEAATPPPESTASPNVRVAQ